MEFNAAPQLDRPDRYVGRTFVRMHGGTSLHRITYSLEEALRLADLPGEREGRIYCFRRVSLSGIPVEANRRVWTEHVQQVLGASATQAVHGTNPAAAAANAVYFDNLEEALETLLRNALRSRSGAEKARPEWFSASVLGVEAGLTHATQISVILQRLRQPSISPAAAAAILFAALGSVDPTALISAIPSHMIRDWVREFEGRKDASGEAPPLRLPSQMNAALQRAAAQFGWKDASTVWLATQAVICLSPSARSSGAALKRARATLRLLEAEQRPDSLDRVAPVSRRATAQLPVFDDDNEIASQQLLSTGRRTLNPAPQSEPNVSILHSSDGQVRSSDLASSSEDMVVEGVPSNVMLENNPPAGPPLLGEPTRGAGLFFLLNVLRRLGIVAALDACTALAEAGLVTHLLKQLAVRAGVSSSDPILLALPPVEEAFAVPAEILADLPLQLNFWPVGFVISQRTPFDSEYLLRVWSVAVRRWCWRSGRISVTEIVQRRGRVALTRSDLDVTLPLAEADIRIRRIGLDIDPGWLPWFGEFGRVVRFHYRDREPERHSC
jgi:hypothetical protein